MEDGVAGRGFIKERGVFGGSMFGITFFQASMKFESPVSVAGRSVEKGRVLALAEEIMGRARRPVARRNMVVGERWDRSGLAGSERERECVRAWVSVCVLVWLVLCGNGVGLFCCWKTQLFFMFRL